MTAGPAAGLAVPGSPAGRTELGMIGINDRVVEKMAARAAAEIPDAGAAAPRVLGRSVTGAAALGTRDEPDRAAESLGRRRRLDRDPGPVDQRARPVLTLPTPAAAWPPPSAQPSPALTVSGLPR
jgi:hypothetical protein